jgi:hypothetical protein
MDGWRPLNELHRPLGLGEKPVDITPNERDQLRRVTWL